MFKNSIIGVHGYLKTIGPFPFLLPKRLSKSDSDSVSSLQEDESGEDDELEEDEEEDEEVEADRDFLSFLTDFCFNCFYLPLLLLFFSSSSFLDDPERILNPFNATYMVDIDNILLGSNKMNVRGYKGNIVQVSNSSGALELAPIASTSSADQIPNILQSAKSKLLAFGGVHSKQQQQLELAARVQCPETRDDWTSDVIQQQQDFITDVFNKQPTKFHWIGYYVQTGMDYETIQMINKRIFDNGKG
ncbi:hypothetical protein J6590_039671 [Homalodisca vitripennis]|nr:hypothetical protein J6590_039669 [Homalodisca vitripennis]KAG8248492.1 hypothetical protein J6590_039671 [Homalodisca vitripennis]